MTNRAQSRRDPQKGKKGFSKYKGFTVIELLIVVAVIAIITSLALPSYRAIIEKRRLTSGAEQLAAFLSSVQLEAVKRSENITVSYQWTSENNWCVGFAAGTDPCDCTVIAKDSADCKVGDAVRVFNQDSLLHPEVVQPMAGDGSFVFDPARGIVYNNSDFSAYDSADFDLLSENGAYALSVGINQVGRVKSCSGVDKEVPGYAPCAN